MSQTIFHSSKRARLQDMWLPRLPSSCQQTDNQPVWDGHSCPSPLILVLDFRFWILVLDWWFLRILVSWISILVLIFEISAGKPS